MSGLLFFLRPFFWARRSCAGCFPGKRAAFCLSLCLFLAQCSVSEQMEKAQKELEQQFQELPAYESLPTQKLSWQTAHKHLLTHNLEIQKARQEIQTAQDGITRVFTNFIPSVNLGYYYNKALNNSNSSSYYATDEFNYNINIIFNLPALTQIPVDYYVAKLALFRAEKNLELKERELTSRLYQTLKNIELNAQKYEQQKSLTYRTESATSLLELEEARKIEKRNEWLLLAVLFNEVSHKWEVQSKSLPTLNLSAYEAKKANPDALSLTFMAMELEASRLKKLGITLQYWPTVHVNFYSPQLFNVTGGNNTGFMGSGNKDIRLDMNFYLQLDTRLETYRQLKQAKADHHLLVQALKMQLVERREKLSLLLHSTKEFEHWMKSTQKAQQFYARRGEIDAESLLARHKEFQKTDAETLTQKNAQIEREAALILEYGLLP